MPQRQNLVKGESLGYDLSTSFWLHSLPLVRLSFFTCVSEGKFESQVLQTFLPTANSLKDPSGRQWWSVVRKRKERAGQGCGLGLWKRHTRCFSFSIRPSPARVILIASMVNVIVQPPPHYSILIRLVSASRECSPLQHSLLQTLVTSSLPRRHAYWRVAPSSSQKMDREEAGKHVRNHNTTSAACLTDCLVVQTPTPMCSPTIF